MKLIYLAALGICLAAPAAAYEDEGLPETVNSTDTARSEDDEGALVQESDDDLAAFVTDYIRKDIQLKGAFLLEDAAAKKILKLELVSVEPKAGSGENGARSITARFKDAAGKKYTALFWLQGGPWGGLDIFKIELKQEKAAPAPKKAPAKKAKG